MSDLNDAAKALRDSVAALPEPIRSAEPWRATTYGGEVWWVDAGGVSIANCGQGDTAQRLAKYIAAVGNAARGLPDLLQAIGDRVEVILAGSIDGDGAVAAIRIYKTAESLAALINRSQP